MDFATVLIDLSSGELTSFNSIKYDLPFVELREGTRSFFYLFPLAGNLRFLAYLVVRILRFDLPLSVPVRISPAAS